MYFNMFEYNYTGLYINNNPLIPLNVQNHW